MKPATQTQEEVLPRLLEDLQAKYPSDGPTFARERQRLCDGLKARAALGLQHYGRPLMSFNGRDPMRDALEEVLDLAMYVKQWEMERSTDEWGYVADLRWRVVDLAFEILRWQRDA